MSKTSSLFPVRRTLALSVLFSAAFPGWAAFKDPGYGARPMGMGGAFVALADDENAVFYNPAGTVQADRFQASFMNARLFLGLGEDLSFSLNSFFSAFPLSRASSAGKHSLGFGWTNFRAGTYREDTLLVNGALSLAPWLPRGSAEVAVGANVKYLKTRYEVDSRAAADPVFAQGRGKGVPSADVGLWLRPDPWRWPRLRLGLAARDVNQPDIGLLAEDRVRASYALGMAAGFKATTLALDFVQRAGVVNLRGGLESRFLKDRFALRGGGSSDGAAAGMSYLFNFGERTKVGIDYTFSIPLGELQGTDGGHRVSFRMTY